MDTLEALAEERRGYVQRGLDDRIAQVDAEIARIRGLTTEKATADPVVETAVKAAPAARKPKR